MEGGWAEPEEWGAKGVAGRGAGTWDEGEDYNLAVVACAGEGDKGLQPDQDNRVA
jgi:hypothetical protein